MSKASPLARIKETIIHNPTIVESGKMYVAEGIGMLFAFLIMLTKSKLLTVDEVGLINYIVALVSLTSAFFNFGLDNTAARVVLNEKTKADKEKVTGTALLLSIILAEIYGIILIAINLSVPLWGNTEVQPLVYLILPFAGYNIVLVTYKQICYANGSIREASIQLSISYILYWIFLLIAHFLGFLDLKVALISSYGINMATVVIPILFFHWKHIRIDKSSFQKIRKEQRERGWKIYLSRVFFSSTFNLDTLILGIFHPLDAVAHYTIAKYIAMPVSMIGNSVSQSTYRKYSDQKKISRKLISRVTIITVIAAIVMMVVGVLMVLFLGKEYYGMLAILPLAILYSVINGVSAIFNSFMNAKGMAEELKRLAIIGAIANLVFNFALIIPFGALGGVVASLLVIITILIARVFYCKKYEALHEHDE